MAVIIKPVNPNKSELTKFIQFGIDHYKGNTCYVPPLISDELNTLLPDKNPAFDFCEAQSFMAYRDDKPVGRITGIINKTVNSRTGEPTVRFGFIEFIDDDEVVDALIGAVEKWGKERGMTSIVGPLGFTDLDNEGMLTSGYDEIGTMATIYNYDYYPRQMERLGMEKEAEWVEFRIKVPEQVPDRIARVGDIVKRRFNLTIPKPESKKELKEKYGHRLFELINEAYDDLYGYSPLTERQIDHYIDQYLGILDLRDVCVITDKDDNLVGVGISIPSFSKALQKSGGKMLPLGWWHLLKALKGKNDVVDLLLVAVKKEYQSKGVNALLFTELIPQYNKKGYKFAESNPELMENKGVQSQWEYFEYRRHRRRCAYKKNI
ncbi:MAG: N-acetyltransferase [Muribaculaceae bacterium]